MRILIVALFAVFTLQACTTDLTSVANKDSKWELTEFPGKTLPTSSKATLNITDGKKINGNSFCNSYGGNAVINGSAIQFTNTFATKMYCAEVGNLENDYLAAINKVNAGKISGNKLHLYNNGQLLLVFSKVQ